MGDDLRARILLDGREHDVQVHGAAFGDLHLGVPHREPGDAGAALRLSVTVDGLDLEVTVEPRGDGVVVRCGKHESAADADAHGNVLLDGVHTFVRVVTLQGVAGAGIGPAADGKVRTPMAGRIVRVAVTPGQEVAKGTVLYVLEAMKMQNEVRSPLAGKVAGVHAKDGETVESGRVVVELG